MVLKLAEGGNKKEAKRGFSEGLKYSAVLAQDKKKFIEKGAIPMQATQYYHSRKALRMFSFLFFLSPFELGILRVPLGSKFTSSAPALSAVPHTGSYTAGSR